MTNAIDYAKNRKNEAKGIFPISIGRGKQHPIKNTLLTGCPMEMVLRDRDPF
jgi:hypothetical protein